MSVSILIPIAAFTINLFIGSYVLGRRRPDLLTQRFLLVTAASGGWILGDILMLSPVASGYEAWISKAQSLFWVPTGVLFLSFAGLLTGRRPVRITAAAAAFSIAGVALFWGADWIPAASPDRSPEGLVAVHRHLGVVCTGINLCLVGYAGWMGLAARSSKRDRVERAAVRLFLAGAATAMGALFLFHMLLPGALGADWPLRFASSWSSCYVVILLMAVSKRRSLDITVDRVAEALFEEIDDGILLLDGFGQVLRTNGPAARLLMDGETGPKLRDLFDAREGGGAHRGGIACRLEGERRVLSVTIAHARSPRSAVERIVIVRDVTDQSSAEQILVEARATLAQEVEKRVLALRHAQKMEAIGTLAGGIAHDFNNILAAISGFTHAALTALPRAHPVRSDLNEVMVASRRAREIVQQMLTFSQQQDAVSKAPVAAREMLEEAVELLRATQPPNVRLRPCLEAAEGMVIGDPTQLSQVLTNLGTNAFQAMRGCGSGVLTIDARRTTVDVDYARAHPPLAAGEHICIAFRDTGCGMTEETLAHAFDPFFTSGKPGGGSGLGLSTALALVRQHGGTIAAKSAPDRGSCFTVFLPILDAVLDAPMPSRDTIRGEGEHILVVDDEVSLQRLAKRLLTPLGYRVSTFSNGEEALTAFTADPAGFDLVVTDQTMPKMTGIRLAGALLEIRPALPIILLSGYGAAVRADEVSAAGIRKFLKKPVPGMILALEIRALLDAPPGWAAPADSC